MKFFHHLLDLYSQWLFFVTLINFVGFLLCINPSWFAYPTTVFFCSSLLMALILTGIQAFLGKGTKLLLHRS
ncbi:MAG: hypothetical protein AAGG80_06085 [Pseudomonadota bacterium]